MQPRWPTRRYVFVFLVVGVVATVLSYAWLFSSEPYHLAKGFVANDPRVLQVTGAQQSSRVSPFILRLTMGDRSGEGEFTFVVKGERGEFDVLVEMEKRDWRWAVTRAQAIPAHGATTDIVGTRRCAPCGP